MLVQLTIQNFLSFRDEVTFSLVGVNSDQQHADHLAKDAAGKGRSLLPISAIYGANGAGKSNLIEAVSFAKQLILEGTRSGKAIPIPTFKLGNYDQQPSKFEFIFTYEGTLYSYGFQLNREQILQEWLYATPFGKKKEVAYFERETSKNKQTSIEFGTPLKGRSEKRKQFLDFIAEGTRPNQLFLTEAIDRNVQVLTPVFNWFAKVLTVIPAEADYRFLELQVLGDQTFTDFLGEFLRFTGTGIDAISTEQVELDFDNHFPNMPESMRDDLRQQFTEVDKPSVLIIEDSAGRRAILLKDNHNQLQLIQIKTQHRHEDGHLIDFAIEEESDGTQRLINLIPMLFVLKTESEKVVFLDELDRRLHPLLSRRFLQTALNSRGGNNQLVFTTHDTNLLDLDLLRRDEIWLVEKNQQGVSNLYSLAEFKIRPDLKIEKGYLNGRFGGIPFFGDPQGLGWVDCKAGLSIKTS